MPTAFSLVPHRFGDGRDCAILEGLRAVGFAVRDLGQRRGQGPGDWLRPRDDRDVLVTWTVHRGALEACRDFFEEHGGRVIVAEEAHVRRVPDGPFPGDTYFSLCLHDHQGRWHAGGPERWASWNIEIEPWRRHGARVLVREQRGIGSTLMASPRDWHLRAAEGLRALTGRPVETVVHPKTLKRRGLPSPGNDEIFADAWCVVTWASHMGTQALLHGVPVIARAPRFFLQDACGDRLDQIDDPPRPPRGPAFERFAWAQWSMTEIRDGTAFDHLLRCP